MSYPIHYTAFLRKMKGLDKVVAFCNNGIIHPENQESEVTAMNTKKVIEFKRWADRPEQRRPASPTFEADRIQRGKLLFLKNPAEPEKTTADGADKRHIINAFIEDALLDPASPVITQREEHRLRQAIAPLLAAFPIIDEKIFTDTRNEYHSAPKPPPNTIAKQEAQYWQRALGLGLAPIPGFDFSQAQSCFHLEEDKWYRMRHGEMFFFIILRMCRRQYQYTAIRKRREELQRYWNKMTEERTSFKMSVWDFLKAFF
jgi:hypothetical protein